MSGLDDVLDLDISAVPVSSTKCQPPPERAVEFAAVMCQPVRPSEPVAVKGQPVRPVEPEAVRDQPVQPVELKAKPKKGYCVYPIEKGIRIEYPYNFGLPLGNSTFVTIWLEFDLFVCTIVQI